MKPRHLIHRGSVLASAYVLDDTPHARAAVLRRWRPGHELWEWGTQLVWHLPEPERTTCETAPGLPLVAIDRRLCGAPLSPDELVDLPPGITVVEHGAVVSRPVGKAVDVSKWLDVTAFTLAAHVEPLGHPPPPPAVVYAPRPKADARTALGFAPLTQEGAAVAEAVRTGQPLPPPPQPAPGQAQPISVGPVARGLVSGLRSVTRWVNGLFRRPETAAPTSALGPPRRGWLQRLDAWLARLLESSRLGAIVGQRQADYLSRLMDMFEHGDLDAALKHAIPLASGRTPGTPQPTLLNPSPRASLDIPLRPHAAATSAVPIGDYYEQLRRRYRAAAQKLEAEGRYKEAAFVLSELLQADEEAIALLERHEQYELAAELAEARQLAPGVQVRQWFLAKNIARAVAVARRHGVFGDAVARLSRSKHDAEAKQLRLLWADAQARSGDFYNAVITLWAHEDARPLTRRWLELGIAQGGPHATRLEVKRLVLDGAKADPKLLLATLDADDPERAAERALLTTELQSHSAEVEKTTARTLARAAVRTVMRDALGPASPSLLSLAADGALKADMPQHRMPEVKLSARTPPLRVDIEPFDRGALAVHDAAMLPDGRLVLALGEAGVRLVTRDGRTAKHFDVPAQSLVPYDLGGRVLCLAQRGEVLVAARIDVIEGTIEPLPQLRLSTWADGTDGSMWFVYDGHALCGLDLHDPKLPALWRTPMPGLVGRPMRNALSLTAVPSPAPGELEWWRYELPSLTLRVRQALALPQINERVAVMADGNMCITQGGIAWQQQHTGATRRQLTGLAGGVIVDVQGAGEWFSLVARGDACYRWMLTDLAGVTVRHVAQLPRAAAFTVRMRQDVALYADHDGRVLAVDLTTGRLLRDLRVR